jgi:hypothetical protein
LSSSRLVIASIAEAHLKIALGAIVGLLLPRKEWIVGIDEHALQYCQEYCHVNNN